ncbi:MAG: hypothetical protein P8L85_23195 [Rubripirellula sp.]|nr:hypothetical protein [Rubripirellula sp.]
MIVFPYRKVYPRPTKYVLAAIVINVGLTCGLLVFQNVLARYLPPQSYAVAVSSLTLLSTVGSLGAFALILIAVFIERDPTGRSGSREDDLGGLPRAGQPSKNPYIAPRQ